MSVGAKGHRRNARLRVAETFVEQLSSKPLPFRLWLHLTRNRKQLSISKTCVLFAPPYICSSRVLAVAVAINLGLTKVGNQAKPLKYSEKAVFLNNLEQMIQLMATDVNTELTVTDKRSMHALNNARLLPGIRCCLYNTANNIVYNVNWR